MKLTAPMLLLLTIMLAAVSSAADLHPAPSEPSFDAANRLYEQGKYREAAKGYEVLLRAGVVSSALHYNLGNSWQMVGEPGLAIAHYRLAERLDPRDHELRANLSFVRTAINPQISAPSGGWRSWPHLLSLNEWTLLAAVTVWVWFALLAATQWRPEWKPRLRRAVFGSGFGLVISLAFLLQAVHHRYQERQIVVIARETPVRFGPLEESKSSFTVRSGEELDALDAKGSWIEVRDGAGRTGWISHDHVLDLNRPLPPNS